MIYFGPVLRVEPLAVIGVYTRFDFVNAPIHDVFRFVDQPIPSRRTSRLWNHLYRLT
jgi:hypothetical protein